MHGNMATTSPEKAVTGPLEADYILLYTSYFRDVNNCKHFTCALVDIGNKKPTDTYIVMAVQVMSCRVRLRRGEKNGACLEKN